jgi:hypothetical protein
MSNLNHPLITRIGLILVLIITSIMPSAYAISQTPGLLEVRQAVAPVIPLLVLVARINSEVIVELEIDREGAVRSAHITQGHPLLRKLTEDAAMQWQFEAAQEERRKVTLTFVYNYGTASLDAPIKVLPYQLELEAKLQPPPDTVSYIPKELAAGKSRCEIHSEVLQNDKVKIAYGLVAFQGGYLEAQESLFSNSNMVVYGGCVIDEYSPKYAEVLYCQKCRQAEEEWTLTHRNR